MTIVKILVSAILIAIVTQLATYNPKLSGWITAFPLISMLSLIWLTVQNEDRSNIINFLTGVLWGLIPCTILLATVLLSLKKNFPFPVAILLGICTWTLYTFIYQRVV